MIKNNDKLKELSKNENENENENENNKLCDTLKNNINKNDTFMNEYNKNTLYNIKNINIHKNSINFLVEKTDYPDVYKLFLLNNDNTPKYINIAYVPTILHSMNLVNIFKNNNDKQTNIKSIYAIDFKKWIPIERCENIDNYSKIELFN